MFSYPYFNLPYYHRYSRYGYHYPNSTSNTGFANANTKKHIENTVHKEKENTTKKEECSSNIEDSPLFQIFGINLYFDDILLVCLIFFLYQEGVKDESLFIALILLLLS